MTGFLGPVIALIIYLVYKDRSRYVAYHSMQAFIFQLLWWVSGGVLKFTLRADVYLKGSAQPIPLTRYLNF